MPTLTNSQLAANAALDNWIYGGPSAPALAGFQVLQRYQDVGSDIYAALVGQTNAAGKITSISLVFRGTQFSGASSHPGATFQDLLDDLQIAEGQSSNTALKLPSPSRTKPHSGLRQTAH